MSANYNTQPHFVDPLVAPKPQKLMHTVPAEVSASAMLYAIPVAINHLHHLRESWP